MLHTLSLLYIAQYHLPTPPDTSHALIIRYDPLSTLIVPCHLVTRTNSYPALFHILYRYLLSHPPHRYQRKSPYHKHVIPHKQSYSHQRGMSETRKTRSWQLYPIRHWYCWSARTSHWRRNTRHCSTNHENPSHRLRQPCSNRNDVPLSIRVVRTQKHLTINENNDLVTSLNTTTSPSPASSTTHSRSQELE